MAFSVAQVFYLDSARVQHAQEIGISSIDLYFKQRPDPTNNKSGIASPGVDVFICPTSNSIPVLDAIDHAPRARLEYSQIQPSGAALIPSNFRFNMPVSVQTNQSYAFVVKFDGDEDFVLWTDVQGQDLVGTSTPSPGPSGQYVGQYFTYVSAPANAPAANSSAANSSIVSVSTSSAQALVPNSAYTSSAWRPGTDTSLKFTVYCARYAVNGDRNLAAYLANTGLPSGPQVITQGDVTSQSVSNGVLYTIPSARYEYVLYDRTLSSRVGTYAGERAYQNTVFWPGGSNNSVTVAVANGSTNVTISGATWANVIPSNTSGGDAEWIVITSQNHLGANADVVAVRRIVNVLSNTQVSVDRAVPFTNGAARFFRSPVARIDQFANGKVFGTQADILIMTGSSANATMRFANHTIMSASVTAGGSTYSNSDVVTFTGFESVAGKVLGGYPAKANLVTNSTGGVVSVNFSNLGCGFTNSSAIVVAVANSTGGNSSGSGLTLAANVGAIIKGEMLGQDGKGGYFQGCRLVNLEIGYDIPGIVVHNPPGTFYSAQHRLPYYSVDDATTSFGKAYYCDADGNWDQYVVTPFSAHHAQDFQKRRVMPSWSNEWNVPYANGSPCNALGGSTFVSKKTNSSNASVLLLEADSNNDFSAITFGADATTVTFYKYIVNYDYTNENTNYGNAFAKGIETRVNFANGTTAEDLLVFATVYRPANTDVQILARLYNSTDNDAFDDKDWTLLVQRDGNTTFSSSADANNFIEITYGLPASPNSAFTLVGSATTANGSNVITGVGTSWSTNATANLHANDVVKIYQPLFPTNMMIAVVDSVANDTQFTLKRAVTNNGVIGSGMRVDKVAFPHQVFSYGLNSNVARYFNSSMAPFDGFDTLALKVVLLSADGVTVPLVDDVRAVGASA